jgi:hypothetical protein
MDQPSKDKNNNNSDTSTLNFIIKPSVAPVVYTPCFTIFSWLHPDQWHVVASMVEDRTTYTFSK